MGYLASRTYTLEECLAGLPGPASMSQETTPPQETTLGGRMTDEENVNTEGGRCPWCKSDQITGEDIDYHGGTLTQEMNCNNPECEKSWSDTYKLVGYEPDEADPLIPQTSQAAYDELTPAEQGELAAHNELTPEKRASFEDPPIFDDHVNEEPETADDSTPVDVDESDAHTTACNICDHKSNRLAGEQCQRPDSATVCLGTYR